MKYRIVIVIALLLALGAALLGVKTFVEYQVDQQLAEQQMPTAAAAPVPEETAPETTAVPSREPITQVAPVPTEIPTETTEPMPVRSFTAEEEELLLKIGMAERGDTYCTDCIALVMCTVLNRVEAPDRFGSTIRSVIYAADQFTPVADGSFEKAEPNAACLHALEWIRSGWDESQGALYYEWCEGESWHSQNLNLLLQHCDTRFYN